MKLLLALVGLLALLLGIASGTTPAEAAPGLLQLPWPAGTQHRISGGYTYGCVTHSTPTATGYAADYYAIDFQFGPGDGSPLDVSAVAGGTVIVRDDLGDGYGWKVVLDHGGGYVTVYAHFRETNPFTPGITEGVTVAPGQLLGYAGQTGQATGVHLHFHMQQGNAAHKPEPMSWVSGFGQYGFCTGVTSPYWASRPPVVIVSGDYDGDGKTDLAVWRLASDGQGTWYVRNQFTVEWGLRGDVPVPGDYDGDGDTDLAVWRPSNGNWYVRNQFTIEWGVRGDVPVPGDYDGDGKTDLAVWRPSNGKWYIRTQFTVPWGASGDVPVPGDYNGDGKTDTATWRPSNGNWYVREQFTIQWGVSTDIPVPGDYDFRIPLLPRTDLAVWRPSNRTWYVCTLPASDPCPAQNKITQEWGLSGDVPVPGDYDYDGKTDFAAWRPFAQGIYADGTWHVLGQFSIQWGVPDDVPLAGHHSP